jgi:hypothetical protein
VSAVIRRRDLVGRHVGSYVVVVAEGKGVRSVRAGYNCSSLLVWVVPVAQAEN